MLHCFIMHSVFLHSPGITKWRKMRPWASILSLRSSTAKESARRKTTAIAMEKQRVMNSLSLQNHAALYQQQYLRAWNKYPGSGF